MNAGHVNSIGMLLVAAGSLALPGCMGKHFPFFPKAQPGPDPYMAGHHGTNWLPLEAWGAALYPPAGEPQYEPLPEQPAIPNQQESVPPLPPPESASAFSRRLPSTERSEVSPAGGIMPVPAGGQSPRSQADQAYDLLWPPGPGGGTTAGSPR